MNKLLQKHQTNDFLLEEKATTDFLKPQFCLLIAGEDYDVNLYFI